MSFIFTPPEGYRNQTSFPTTPTSEAEFRNSMQSLLDQLRDEINAPTDSAAAYALYNKIINGNFDVAQRGTAFANPGSGTYLLDRWRNDHSPDGGAQPTRVYSRGTISPGDLANSFYFLNINLSGAGSGFGANSFDEVVQCIEHGTRYLCGAGKKLTVSFYARSTIPGKKLGVYMAQNYGTGGSPSGQSALVGQTITLTPILTKYTITFSTDALGGKTFGSNNDDFLKLSFIYEWGANNALIFGTSGAESYGGAGDIIIGRVQVNAGDAALPFQPRSFAEELALCRRYYWKTFKYSTAPAQATADTAGAIGYVVKVGGSNFDAVQVQFPVSMRIPPTLTTYNPSSANNRWRNISLNTDSGPPSTLFVSENGFLIVNNPQVAGDGANTTIGIHAAADADF